MTKRESLPIGEPVEKDQNFNLEFSVDIVEDIVKDVEDVAKMSTIGQFQDARALSEDTLERYLNAFPIAMEALRLSYDQGDYRSTLDTLAKLDKNDWSTQERWGFRLIETISKAYCYGGDTRMFEEDMPRPDTVDIVRNSSLESLDDVDILLLVLRLRASYLEHEFKEPLPKDRFSVNLGLRLNVSLHDFLPHLLEHERHWAAENVLEMCFRKSGNKSHRIELTAIWHSIKDFVTMDVLENNEETVWAQIAILQTFCEGTLRRQQLQLPKGQGTDIWKQSKHIMAQLLQKLNNCSSGHHWIRSRACMRQKLIELDYSILKRTAESDHSVTGEDLETLNSLKAQAASSFDIRLGDVTQWRIEILAACKDPQYISVPAAFPVPERLYAKRQKLVDSIEESERMNRATKCQEWWTTISSSRSDLDGQDAMSMTSGERAHRCLDKPDVPVTKRVLLMGYVGTGKSTLLRTLTNKYAATSNRRACTQVLQRETCQMADGSMVECIDTPGFGDPDIADYTNLRKICEYLKAEAKANRCLHSVFYLINLGNNRLDKSTVQLAKLFKEIVGPDVWRNVCFIYTCGVNPKLAETDRGSRRELKEQKRRANLDYAELFGEAKVSGAHFADLGLDNSDCTILIAEPALSAQHDINVAQDGQKSEDDEGHTHVDSSGEGDDGGRSNESYQPADRNQVMKIIEEMISRPGPILLECQREMAERDVPFEETQAALVYEDDRRSEWDATTQSEARADRERLDAEAAAHEQEREAERLREQQVKDDRERKARSEEEARARERETEIQRLQEQQEVNDRDKKDWKERLAEAERKAAAQQEADEAHKRQMRDIQLQREKEERERKKLREDLARAEQLAKAERAKAEEALRKMEEAAARRRKLERDINAIESSPGWTPRFIIQNKTQVPLHIKMRNAALLHMPTSHQNDLLPGKLRAMHAISGFHGFEAYFRVRSNALTASGQALEGLGTAAYIIGTAALGAVFAPGWIAAVTIGAVCGRLWAEVQRQVDPDTPKASGFESNIKQGEDDSVFMSCKPDEDLQKFTEVQMLIMEATRQGKNMFLFRGPDFRLIRTTRLQICGGPSAVEVPSKGYTRYEFKRTTQPIRMERIGAFIVEG